MLVISILAMLAYVAVIGRCLWFCRISHRQRSDDRAEVARMASIEMIMFLSMAALLVTEPWRLESNNLITSLFMGHTIVISAYFFHRIDSMIRGRERREAERRQSVVARN